MGVPRGGHRRPAQQAPGPRGLGEGSSGPREFPALAGAHASPPARSPAHALPHPKTWTDSSLGALN